MRASVVSWFRRLKTALWLAAWGAWVWLGFGLYRELPRDLGPIVARLQLEPNEYPWGFMPGDESVLTVRHDLENNLTAVRLRSFEDGRILRECPGIRNAAPFDIESSDSLMRHRLLLAAERPAITGRQKPEADSVLDLRTMEWLDLGKEYRRHTSPHYVHAEKPWAIYRNFDENTRQTTTHRVVDLTSGATLFRMPRTPNDWMSTYLQFVPKTDWLVGWRFQKNDLRRRASLEVWDVGDKSTAPLRSLFDVGNEDCDLQFSDNRRVAVADFRMDFQFVDVYDLDTGKKLFESTPAAARQGSRGYSGRPDGERAFSADGATIFHSELGEAWDVDSGRSLWQIPKRHKYMSFDRSRNEVQVREWWTGEMLGFKWDRWIYSVRDFRTYSLQYRWWYEKDWTPEIRSHDGRFEIDHAGRVRESMPYVNWLLLSGCQAILALPLLALFAFARWRRRRALPKSAVGV